MTEEQRRLEKIVLDTERQMELVTRELAENRRALADAKRMLQLARGGSGSAVAGPGEARFTREADGKSPQLISKLRSAVGRRGFLRAATGLAALTGASALVGRASVSADVPAVINYQGRLTDPNGNPLSGTYNMTFALYGVPTGGTALWSEPRNGANAVPVNNGLFSVMLGSVQAIPKSVFDSSPLHLGISVGSDPEMTPREQLGSVPFAMQVADGSVTTPKIADGAVTSPKLSLPQAEIPLGANLGILATASLGTTLLTFPNLPAGKYIFYGLAACYVDPDGVTFGAIHWEINDGSTQLFGSPHFFFTVANGYQRPQSAGFTTVIALPSVTTINLAAYKDALTATTASGATRFGYIRIA